MIFDKGTSLGGFWHCPFTKEWVNRMKHAVKHCEGLSAEYIERALVNESLSYQLPPGDFLSEEQDARGLPMSYVREYERKHQSWPWGSIEIYNYASIPELVITNGEDDWPLIRRGKVLHA